MKILERSVFQIMIVVHNLMVNPSDVPPMLEEVFNENGERIYLGADSWYYENGYDKLEKPPKLWYAIPQFDIDKTELEKLSKEELIELILKERGQNKE